MRSLTRLCCASTGIVAVAIVVVVSTNCTPPLAPVCHMRLEPQSVTLSVNGVATLTATPVDCSGVRVPGRVTNFVAADTAVVRVEYTGRVTGLRVGTTSVSAVSNGKGATAQVTVVQ